MTPTEGPSATSTEVDRLRDGLNKILERSRQSSDSWRSDRHYPTEYSKAWHDGYVTALATASLIASEHLDPEGWQEHQERWQLAGHGSDRDWFEKTGNCGHCGNPGEDCCCTPEDPCRCGPHELRSQDLPCIPCKGTGVRRARREAS